MSCILIPEEALAAAMKPSDARDLAIDYGRKAQMHLACNDFAAARKCLSLAKEYTLIGLRLEHESPSHAPSSSPAAAIPAGDAAPAGSIHARRS